MSTLNKSEKIYTHGGTLAKKISNEELLRRSVLSCLLWEKEFYEDGQTIADRIVNTANLCDVEFVANLAFEARNVHGMRHVSMFLLFSCLHRAGKGFKHHIARTIRRPDDMLELLAMYWANSQEQKKKPKGQGHLSDRQLRDGLALAFAKFDEYSLSKFDKKDGLINLRDLMFLTHPKPTSPEQTALFKRIADKAMKTPDTWEVQLSAVGSDVEKKKTVWERLIRNTLDTTYRDRDGQLGYMAVLRNLRNMEQVGVDRALTRDIILKRQGADLVFPFRYTAAARACPSMESHIDVAMQEAIKLLPVLKGTTVVLVDISGSMDRQLSAKSDITRTDAACTLASVINAEDLRVFSFSERTLEVPARRGMAGIDAISKSQRHAGTNLSDAVAHANSLKHDRLIVITDEQDTSGRPVPAPKCQYPYMINVASARNGVGYRNWTHIDGFSEAVLRFIPQIEEFAK